MDKSTLKLLPALLNEAISGLEGPADGAMQELETQQRRPPRREAPA